MRSFFVNFYFVFSLCLFGFSIAVCAGDDYDLKRMTADPDYRERWGWRGSDSLEERERALDSLQYRLGSRGMDAEDFKKLRDQLLESPDFLNHLKKFAADVDWDRRSVRARALGLLDTLATGAPLEDKTQKNLKTLALDEARKKITDPYVSSRATAFSILGKIGDREDMATVLEQGLIGLRAEEVSLKKGKDPRSFQVTSFYALKAYNELRNRLDLGDEAVKQSPPERLVNVWALALNSQDASVAQSAATMIAAEKISTDPQQQPRLTSSQIELLLAAAHNSLKKAVDQKIPLSAFTAGGLQVMIQFNDSSQIESLGNLLNTASGDDLLALFKALGKMGDLSTAKMLADYLDRHNTLNDYDNFVAGSAALKSILNRSKELNSYAMIDALNERVSALSSRKNINRTTEGFLGSLIVLGAAFGGGGNVPVIPATNPELRQLGEASYQVAEGGARNIAANSEKKIPSNFSERLSKQIQVDLGQVVENCKTPGDHTADLRTIETLVQTLSPQERSKFEESADYQCIARLEAVNDRNLPVDRRPALAPAAATASVATPYAVQSAKGGSKP